MTDGHIHIGQYREIYYDPLEIIDIVMSSGITGVAFSSTSSCINNIKYSEVEKEIQQLLSQTSYSSDTIKPYLWYVPDYIHQDVTLESAFSDVPYKGIKIHPSPRFGILIINGIVTLYIAFSLSPVKIIYLS